MKISVFIPVLVVMTFLLLADAYTFRGVMQAFEKLPPKGLRLLRLAYWLVPVAVAVWLTLLLVTGVERDPAFFPRFMLLIGFITLFYFPKFIFSIFLLVDDLWALAKWISLKLGTGYRLGYDPARSRFLLQLGMALSLIPFGSVVHGIGWGRFRFRVVNQTLRFANLPEAFDGFRLLQFSDAHLGSFIGNEDKIRAAVALMAEQRADAIVFTGDIVNNLATELQPFVDILAPLSAPEGKYAVLGNHDYGTHFRWQSAREKDENMQLLFAQHAAMGFRLLNNEHVVLHRQGQSIALVGVENWGLPPFPQHGDLTQAMQGTEQIPFRVLLSHDPSHWDAQVLPNTGIDLTLSGHTHGMQFGIKIGDWQWSPVSMRYPRWGGLYRQGEQYLYVNRGFGVIGFPGRIGMDPEITVFELRTV